MKNSVVDRKQSSLLQRDDPNGKNVIINKDASFRANRTRLALSDEFQNAIKFCRTISVKKENQ